MSQWYFKQECCLGGPVSFTRLARLVVDEELTETDVVCRAGEVEWLPVSAIVGLRQMCDVLSGRRQYTAPTAASVTPAASAPLTADEARRLAVDRAYERTIRGGGEPIDVPLVSRREALLMWGPLGVLGASVAAAAIYEAAYDPWKNRTYQRDPQDDERSGSSAHSSEGNAGSRRI